MSWHLGLGRLGRRRDRRRLDGVEGRDILGSPSVDIGHGRANFLGYEPELNVRIRCEHAHEATNVRTLTDRTAVR